MKDKRGHCNHTYQLKICAPCQAQEQTSSNRLFSPSTLLEIRLLLHPSELVYSPNKRHIGLLEGTPDNVYSEPGGPSQGVRMMVMSSCHSFLGWRAAPLDAARSSLEKWLLPGEQAGQSVMHSHPQELAGQAGHTPQKWAAGPEPWNRISEIQSKRPGTGPALEGMRRQHSHVARTPCLCMPSNRTTPHSAPLS